MNDLLEWLAIGLACLLGAAVLVAGWEHLAREAADAVRENGGVSRHATQAGQQQARLDVALDALDACPADSSASRTAMTAALTRAASARQLHDSAPWLDTCPQVTVGPSEPAEAQAMLLSATAANNARPVTLAGPAPAAAPDIAPAAVRAATSDATGPQTTIERAALR
jgi:hypothetical protein